MVVLRTQTYDEWFRDLKDLSAKVKIAVRVDRLELGNPGDCKSVGQGVMELRIHYGPGYRVYYVQRNHSITLLLCGGDKATQDRDIKRAKMLALESNEDDDDTPDSSI